MRFIYPLDEVRITQEFGADPEFYGTLGQLGHNGIDLGCASGTPVKASADGIIEFEGWGNQTWGGTAAGVYCVINHGDVYTGYAHLSSTIVSKGQSVKQGQVIGYSDATGLSKGAHLHFELIGKPTNWSNGYAGRVNPSNYLNQGEDMKADKNNLYYLYKGVYAVDTPDAVLAKDGFIGTDFGVAAEKCLDYANSKGIAYWQYKAKAEKTIADLNAKVVALQKENDDLKKVTSADATAQDTNTKVNWLVATLKKIFNIQ